MSTQDTSPEAASLLKRLLMSRSGSERVRMASDMFEAAKRLAAAHAQAEGPLDPAEIRMRVFVQLHAPDLDESTVRAVLARLRSPH